MKDISQEKRNIMEGIAQRIRKLRHQRGITMEALAKKAGFTKSYMSQIENLKREPTIGTLVSIAHGLSVDVFTILGSEAPEDQNPTLSIVRQKERRGVSIPHLNSDTDFESINYGKPDRLIDAYILTSGFDFADPPMPHEGQEMLLILEGKQEFVFGGQTYLLEKGDCAYFDAQVPHYGRSVGKRKSKALIVFPIKET